MSYDDFQYPEITSENRNEIFKYTAQPDSEGRFEKASQRV